MNAQANPTAAPGHPEAAALADASPREAKARTVTPLRALWPLVRPYRLRVALALLFLVLAALSTLLVPLALKSLIDQGLVASEPGERLMQLRGHFLALFAVGAALGLSSAGRFYMVTWLGERITSDLRKAVYAHVLRQSPEFFERTQTGEVLSRLTTDTTVVQSVVGSSLSMGLRNLVMGAGALLMLVVTNPGVMGPVLGVLLLVVAPALAFGRRVRRLSRASQDRVADSSALASEVLNGIAVVQAYAQEAAETRRFDASTDQAFAAAVKRTRVRSALVAFVITATFGALLWGLYLGTQSVIRGEISAGHLGQTVVYVMILLGSVAVLSEVWGDMLRAAGATERLMELLASHSPIQSPRPASALPAPATPSPEHMGLRVDFERVHFHYPTRPEPAALRGFDLHIAAGETVALVGPSGAGKSTVLQLLLRFYDVSEGHILLNGMPLPQLDLQALRAAIGIVPQEGVIFSGSALDNIRYGHPEASQEQAEAAARMAHAHDFISQLPQGYHTHLGERGVRLSGGQRQRIAIARALLKNPPLLLLDEATSALDSESERMVQAALEAAMQHRTTLVVAHRLSTVLKADRIVVMESGRIVDMGRHEELLARGGLYARLASLQFDLPSPPLGAQA